MNQVPTLTAAIIALDEADHLAELLPRLDWVDQVVLVDGGSRDATRSVARAHGCRVVSRTFDNFARQRNEALRFAESDWVLSIDADERPIPALVDEIRRKIATTQLSAFRLPIRSWIFGRRFRRSGTQDDLPVRLFRRHAARWTGDVHEVLQVRGRKGRLDHWLEHHTLENLEVFRTKMNRYTSLAAEARVADGIRPRWHARYLAPIRETARRLLWKQGILDGPAGWKFCLLSGMSEWVLARRHRQLWQAAFDENHPVGQAVPDMDNQPPAPVRHSLTYHLQQP